MSLIHTSTRSATVCFLRHLPHFSTRIPVSLSGKVEALAAEKTKQVRVEYQHNLSSLQLELKKMQVEKKEHSKMVTNNSHTEKQFGHGQQSVNYVWCFI